MHSSVRPYVTTGGRIALLTIALCAPTGRSRATEQGIPPRVDAQSTVQAREIHVGQPVDARLVAAGEVHAYAIDVVAGQFLYVLVDQGFVDLVITVVQPDGAEAGQFDGTSYGLEPVSLPADMAGRWHVMVRAVETSPLSARYTVKLETLGPLVDEDRKRIGAEARIIEAKRMTAEGTVTSLRAAVGEYEEALAVWRELGHRYQEAQTLNSVGFLLNALGENRDALERYQQALAHWNALKDAVGESEVIANIGAVHSILGDKREAIRFHEQALVLRRGLGDRRGEGYLLNNLAVTHGELGESQRAVELFAQALPLLESAGEQVAIAATLQNMGAVYATMGEVQKALALHARALTLARGASDRRWEGRTLYNIGTAHRALGDSRTALEWYTRSVALSSVTGDRRTEATSLTNMGTAYRTVGDHERALDYYNRALQVWRAVGDPRGEGLALLELGGLHEERHESGRALEPFERGLSLMVTTGDRRGEAVARRGIAQAHAAMGDASAAEGHFLEALKLARDVRDRANEPQVLLQLGRLYGSQGRLPEARATLEAALPVLESVRAAVLSHELRASYLGSKRQVYEAYIDVLMRLHQTDPSGGFDAVALETSERARARTLLDVLSEAAARIREGADPALLARERELQQLLNTKSERRTVLLASARTQAQVSVLDRDIDQLLAQYRELQNRIRTSSPRYAALAYSEPLTTAEIQRTLDPDTLLVEYWLGEERSFAWAVTPSSVHGVSLPARHEIEHAARRLSALLTAPPGSSTGVPAAVNEATTALSRMILEPLLDTLQRGRVIVVADGALQYIPFGALTIPAAARDGRRALLVEGHEIVSLPSASIITSLRREAAGRPAARGVVAVLADPVFDADDPRVRRRQTSPVPPAERSDASFTSAPTVFERSVADVGLTSAAGRLPRLTFTRQEADAILRLVPQRDAMRAVGFAASRSTATSGALSEYRIVHLATHGLINTVHPELSGIVLSLVDEMGAPQDGFLQLHDIYNLRLPADLVVLSACQSGLGADIRGEGLVGLTRGVMYAGASRVVVSLWRVDDEATAELMKHFYQGMFGPKRLRPAAALHAAQVAMRKESRWISPYFWAGFVLQGEWK